jgi:serine/threonine protein kinase
METEGSPALSGAPAPGTTMGTYRIERLLGRGGMGAVYLAYDTKLHRQIALKTIDASGDREATRGRLLREARSVAALNHPNICTIHEVDEAGGAAFIAMEYVEGRSLADRLREGALPMADAMRYGIEAADALAYAHDHGVVHRDFKAANAMLTTAGRLKIVDFGLARRDDMPAAAATTVASIGGPGQVAGTPYAMAPEQIRGEPADARTDVWALGVLLYEMAAGSKPFDAATTPELFSAILRDPPAPLPAAVPVAIKAVIDRCLEKSRDRRWQRASEVHAALTTVQAGGAAPWQAWSYGLKHRPWLYAVAALVGLAAISLGFDVTGVRERLIGRHSAAPIKLAVLPFENLTGDPEQEYFSDGLTEEMITQLGRLQPQRLSVIARTSSMRYKTARCQSIRSGASSASTTCSREARVEKELACASTRRSCRRAIRPNGGPTASSASSPASYRCRMTSRAASPARWRSRCFPPSRPALPALAPSIRKRTRTISKDRFTYTS